MLTFQDTEAVQYMTVASLHVSCSVPVKMQQPPLHLKMYQLTVRPRSQSADGYKAQSQLRVVSKQLHKVKSHHHAADLVRHQDGVSLCQVLASVTSKYQSGLRCLLQAQHMCRLCNPCTVVMSVDSSDVHIVLAPASHAHPTAAP